MRHEVELLHKIICFRQVDEGHNNNDSSINDDENLSLLLGKPLKDVINVVPLIIGRDCIGAWLDKHQSSTRIRAALQTLC